MDEPTARILAKLIDLYKQATVERSHNYVGSVCQEAVQEIQRLSERELHLLRAIERLSMRLHQQSEEQK